MLRKITSLVGLLLLVVMVSAQNGKIKGTVIDDTGEPLPFANISIEQNGITVSGTQTDFDGKYILSPIKPGSYTLTSSFVGYGTQKFTGVTVSSNKTIFKDFTLSQGVAIDEVKIVQYTNPLIDPDFKSGGTKTREEIALSPLRDVKSIASTTAGVFSQDDGSGDVNIRGSRSDATDIYIDGIKVRGSSGLPQGGIEEVTVITGGVPAQYGDATGGIISVTTRGPAPMFYGGLELVTSEAFDSYGYNLLGLNASGPIIAKEDTALGLFRPILGFFVAGEFNYQKDGQPSALGMWKVKDEVLADLQENPLRQSPTGQGTLKNAEYLDLDPNGDGDYSDGDFEKVKAKQNIAGTSVRLSAKFDFSPSEKFNFTVGGSANYDRGHSYIYAYSLFNPVNNPEYINQTYRVFGRITHRLSDAGYASSEEASSSNIKNAYYSLQVDYSKIDNITQDDNHQANYFNYGYVGSFETEFEDIYAPVFDEELGVYVNVLQTRRAPTSYSFTPSDLNQNAANYTSQYYSIYQDNPEGNWENFSQVQQGGAMLNGSRPSNVYSLWYNTGRQYGGYNNTDASQFRLVGSASADIKDHGLKFGFEYEQRVDRNFSVGDAIGIWGLMRQLANEKNSQLDVDNPIYVTDEMGVFQDTVIYDQLYTGENAGFFENIRDLLGLENEDYVDMDSYDPTTTDLNLGLFTPDELLSNGNSYVTAYGYDYEGNRLSSNPSFDEFFTAKDSDGNFKREQAAFQPIYMAGYIQDKFTFKDIVFNIGLRIDRFDANQKVLKDQFLLYETYNVDDYIKESASLTDIGSVPTNIPTDAYIYVDDVNNPSNIVGFRSGNVWYNGNGTEITDPTIIAKQTSTGQIQPWLVDPSDDIKSENFQASKSFKDYVPQVNVSPRISFSFPISDEAMFFAHYDILSQRPSAGASMLLPSDYLFIESNANFLNNPNLSPERTTDYEFGFTQTLSRSSALTLSAFYRELRDMIQVINIQEAYPITYSTYGNIDFGTVKGFTVKYDLRRTNNVSLNGSYTLQFADGTGSGSSSGVSLVNSGQPNLRTLIPLDYDQRHRINATVDYRFGRGNQYNGPAWGQKMLQDAGANLVFNAGSGLPFSKQSNTTQDISIGVSERSTLKGSLNGARLPWQFRIDGRVNKNIELSFGENGEKKSNLNLYLQVQNVLDAKNVVSVYRATGNPDDTGYLNAADAQNAINGQVNPSSYRDLYSMKMNNPGMYALPRRMRLGIQLDF